MKDEEDGCLPSSLATVLLNKRTMVDRIDTNPPIHPPHPPVDSSNKIPTPSAFFYSFPGIAEASFFPPTKPPIFLLIHQPSPNPTHHPPLELFIQQKSKPRGEALASTIPCYIHIFICCFLCFQSPALPPTSSLCQYAISNR